MYGGGKNIVLVIWKFQGELKGLKKPFVHRPPPMANDLRWRFNVLRRKWHKEFGRSSREEREQPVHKDDIKALTRGMVKAKRAITKVERGAMCVKTANIWKTMGKEAGSRGWVSTSRFGSQGRHTPLVSKELWRTSMRFEKGHKDYGVGCEG